MQTLFCESYCVPWVPPRTPLNAINPLASHGGARSHVRSASAMSLPLQKATCSCHSHPFGIEHNTFSPSLLVIYHFPCEGSPISVDDEKWPFTTSSWMGFLVTQPPRLVLVSRSRGQRSQLKCSPRKICNTQEQGA